MVRALGFEPRTNWLRASCSTTELRPQVLHQRILLQCLLILNVLRKNETSPSCIELTRTRRNTEL